ncbi:MAG: hypothetical protein IPL67_19320 [Ignavibacteria bacterium]|nr:hypothetical protein [Ignavibacteria bacterium]
MTISRSSLSILNTVREIIRRATRSGDHRYDDKVTDNSEAGILARDDSTRNFLAKLTKINYDTFRRQPDRITICSKVSYGVT